MDEANSKSSRLTLFLSDETYRRFRAACGFKGLNNSEAGEEALLEWIDKQGLEFGDKEKVESAA